MKLDEIVNTEAKPVIAWLEPSRGPENLSGVRLAYIQPLVPHFDDMIAEAEEEEAKGDSREAERAKRLRRDKERYVKKGQRFFTPDMGWWMNEKDFHSDKEGFGGAHRGSLQHKYPHLTIVKTRKEAIKAAEDAGLI